MTQVVAETSNQVAKPRQSQKIEFKNDPFSIVRALMTLMVICSLSHHIKYLTGKDSD